MAEQFLDRPKVAAALSRWVAKEWRSAWGVAESGSPSAPRSRSAVSWMIAATAGRRARRRTAGRPGRDDGASFEIGLDRLPDRQDHRHRARLAALADNSQRIHGPDRSVGAPDRQGFRNAQARPIEQGQHRRVARQDPGRAALVARVFARRHFPRPGRGQRLGQGAGELRRPHLVEDRDARETFAAQMARERAQARQLAQQRARRDAFLAPAREEGAQVSRLQPGQLGKIGRRREAVAKKSQKLPEIARIGVERERRDASFARKAAQPEARRRGEIGLGADKGIFERGCRRLSGGRIHADSLAAGSQQSFAAPKISCRKRGRKPLSP